VKSTVATQRDHGVDSAVISADANVAYEVNVKKAANRGAWHPELDTKTLKVLRRSMAETSEMTHVIGLGITGQFVCERSIVESADRPFIVQKMVAQAGALSLT
jgi:hypothetical protein